MPSFNPRISLPPIPLAATEEMMHFMKSSYAHFSPGNAVHILYKYPSPVRYCERPVGIQFFPNIRLFLSALSADDFVFEDVFVYLSSNSLGQIDPSPPTPPVFFRHRRLVLRIMIASI